MYAPQAKRNEDKCDKCLCVRFVTINQWMANALFAQLQLGKHDIYTLSCRLVKHVDTHIL